MNRAFPPSFQRLPHRVLPASSSATSHTSLLTSPRNQTPLLGARNNTQPTRLQALSSSHSHRFAMTDAFIHFTHHPLSFLQTFLMPCEPFQDELEAGTHMTNSQTTQENREAQPSSSSSLSPTKGNDVASSSNSASHSSSSAATSGSSNSKVTSHKHYCCWKQLQQQQSQSQPLQSPARYLIVGLGNPGYPFSGTRHNIGRDFVSMMQKEWGQITRTAPAHSETASSSSTSPSIDGERDKVTFTAFTNHAAHQNSKPKKKQKRENDNHHADSLSNNVAVERVCASQIVSIRSEQLGELQDRFSPAATPEKPRSAPAVDPASSPSSSISSSSTSHQSSPSKPVLNIPPCSCQLNALSVASSTSSSAAAPQCQCRVLLACLDSFMNLSGRPVINLSRHFRIPASRIIVLYDDISLPLGSIRIKNSGSAGGQKGMDSIISSFGGEKHVEGLVRIRIGIAPQMKSDSNNNTAASKSKSKQKSSGSNSNSSSVHVREMGQDGIVARPFARQSDLAKFVLASFDTDEKQIMELVYERVQKAIVQLMHSASASAVEPEAEQASTEVMVTNNNSCACCCTFSLDSNSSRERRLQKAMNRFNGLTITLQDAQQSEH